MPYPKGETPLRALAGRKRLAAARHDAKAAAYRREADELEARAQALDAGRRRARDVEAVRPGTTAV